MKIATKRVFKEGILWEGGDMQPLYNFCGRNWARADVVGAESWPSEIPDKEQVVVFNTAEQCWLPVPVGWWIIRGLRGELYPCKPDIFEETYDKL